METHSGVEFEKVARHLLLFVRVMERLLSMVKIGLNTSHKELSIGIG